MMSDLPAAERQAGQSEGQGGTVLLLHGFGGSAADWFQIQRKLNAPSVAFDLPGHGKAVEWPGDHGTIGTRNAVVEEIERRGLSSLHLVGHSRGGAIAMLVALKCPEKVASLTLIAPGGCGPEIAVDDLAAYANAETREDISAALGRLYAPDPVPQIAVQQVVDQRKNPKAKEALLALVPGLTHQGRQGTLDLTQLRALDCPVSVIWGAQDAVLPASQAENFAGFAHLHKIEGAGHMLLGAHAEAIATAINQHSAQGW